MYVLGKDRVRVVKHLYLLKSLKIVCCPRIECLHMCMGCSMLPQCMDTVWAGHILVSHISVSSSCLSVEPSDSSVPPQFVRGDRTTLALCFGLLGFKALTCILIPLWLSFDCWDEQKQCKGQKLCFVTRFDSSVLRDREGVVKEWEAACHVASTSGKQRVNRERVGLK